MKCPRCQQDNPPQAKFCLECAAPLRASTPGGPHAPSYAEVTTALSEALDQQTATSEVLRVISSSPADIQPVLDAMTASAVSLCSAQAATVFRRDGDRLQLVAHHGPIAVDPVGEFSLPVSGGSIGGRSVLEQRTIHGTDVQAEEQEYPEAARHGRRFGHRTLLSVPLLKDGRAP